MAGQIIKRGDKTWLLRIFMGRDGSGKRRYMNKTVRGNKKDAEAFLRKTQTQISCATVQRTLCWRRQKGGGWYFGEPKTSQSRRTVPLPSSIVRELGRHKVRQATTRLRKGAKYQLVDLVFATETGRPLHSENLATRNFRVIRDRAKLPAWITPYSLRHTCATLLLLAGENPKVVSERLGHSSVVMTLDTYSHVLPCMQQAATEKLEKMLFG
ncbi:MAG TPA: site-specific integrase [Pyrinomonadaceae bacterium]|nr:site-specific integrase [Pyrinomonadaceae bacterium]